MLLNVVTSCAQENQRLLEQEELLMSCPSTPWLLTGAVQDELLVLDPAGNCRCPHRVLTSCCAQVIL